MVLRILTSSIKLISVVYEPYMPSFSAKVNFFLGEKERTAEDETKIKQLLDANSALAIFQLVRSGQEMNQPFPLFKKCNRLCLATWNNAFWVKRE